MNINYKIFFKYIFFYKNNFFFKNLFRNDKNTNLFLNQNDLYYLIIHFKLSTIFYSTQLVDMFVYDLILNNKINKNINYNNNSIIVYNFHLIKFQQRIYLFIKKNFKKNFKNDLVNLNFLNSISEVFLNANWLEREISELHGFFFIGKKDLRNLMLPYGDTSAPMQKSFPSIGVKEIFYDSINDLLIQNSVSIQF